MVEIRQMKENESKNVIKLGRKTFEWFESLFIPKPKACYVAVENEEIVGAVIYKYYKVKGKKIGYIDHIFVDKKAQGKKIGSRLMDQCLKAMDLDGCDGYSALVRDDNVGSWKMFLDRGFKRMGFMNLIQYSGITGMFMHIFQTPITVATGYEYYLLMKNTYTPSKTEKSNVQIMTYLIYMILILMPIFIYGLDYGIYIIGGMLSLISARIIAGYIGTLFSKKQWYFRVTEGGFLILFLSTFFGGIYIIIGNWYPKVYRRDATFKRSMGLTACGQWLALVCIVGILKLNVSENVFFEILYDLGRMFMLASIVPFYPFSPLGGKRIYRWNKLIYSIALIISLVLAFL